MDAANALQLAPSTAGVPLCPPGSPAQLLPVLPAAAHPPPIPLPAPAPPLCSKWLAEPTWEAEAEFWRTVCERCKVILTPGHDCHAAEPGFFRLCFAWMQPKALPEAVRRIKLLMGGGAGGASECSVQ